MSASFTVDVDVSKIVSRFDDSRLRSAQEQYAMRVATDSNRYCKWDTGDTYDSMAQNSDFAGGAIRWTTPYAREAYEDPRVGNHPSEPNGKTEPHPKWFEVAKERHLAQWEKLAGRLLGNG